MRSKEWFVSLIIVLSLLSLGGCEKEPVAKIGDVAPDFTLPTLEGQEITLSQFKGKNIFLLFGHKGVSSARRGVLLW